MTASQRKGTAFESSLIPQLQVFYPGAIRLGKQGRVDKGDFYLPGEDRYVIEAKNVSRFNLSEWYGEAVREAANAGRPFGVVVHKRRGTTDGGDQWVTTTLSSFLGICNWK